MEPVPALTRMPADSPNAAARAISMSPRTSTRLATPAATIASANAVCSGARPAPAAPTKATVAGRATLACAAARRATSRMTAADRSAPPGRIADEGHGGGKGDLGLRSGTARDVENDGRRSLRAAGPHRRPGAFSAREDAALFVADDHGGMRAAGVDAQEDGVGWSAGRPV